MSIQQPAPMVADTQDRWLSLRRTAWLILAGLTTVIFIASVPPMFAQLQATCTAPPCFGWQLTADDAHALRGYGLSMGFYAVYALVLNTLLILPFLLVGALVIWRKGRDRSAVLMALILALFAAAGALNVLSTIWDLPDALWNVLIATSSVLLFFLFPNGKFVPRWSRGVVLVPSFTILIGVLIPQWSEALSGITSLAAYLTGISAQIYRYRSVSTPTERQQAKWAVFGISLAIVSFICLTLIGGFFPQTSTIASGGLASLAVDTIWPLSYTLIPVSIGVAILRSRLYDIDVIIRRTLVYSILTALLITLYVGSVALLDALLQPLLGQGNDLVIVATTLAVAALFNPLRRRIQAFIDRRFYRRKYDAARTLEAFSATLRDEVDLNRLAAELVEAVEETMQPASVSLWLGPSERQVQR